MICSKKAKKLVGAVGIHTREDKILIFNAKALLLGTGKCSRPYPSLTPGWMFNDGHGGIQTGGQPGNPTGGKSWSARKKVTVPRGCSG